MQERVPYVGILFLIEIESRWIRQNLVEEQSEGIDVGSCGDRVQTELFRCTVLPGEHLPPFRRDSETLPGRFGIEHLGNSKVKDLNIALFGHQQIVRFQIPVYNGIAVSILHSLAQLNKEVEPLPAGASVLNAVIGQRYTIYELHYIVSASLIGNAPVQKFSNIGMRKFRKDEPLLLEAKKLLPGGILISDHFEGHILMKVLVDALGQNNVPHSALGNSLFNPILSSLYRDGELITGLPRLDFFGKAAHLIPVPGEVISQLFLRLNELGPVGSGRLNGVQHLHYFIVELWVLAPGLQDLQLLLRMFMHKDRSEECRVGKEV